VRTAKHHRRSASGGQDRCKRDKIRRQQRRHAQANRRHTGEEQRVRPLAEANIQKVGENATADTSEILSTETPRPARRIGIPVEMNP
jgi:hypothetical protein